MHGTHTDFKYGNVMNNCGKIKKYERLPERLKNKWSREDFYYYRMQNMNVSEITDIASPDELWNREKILNDDRYRHIFNDKKEFFLKFSDNKTKKILGEDYIRRNIIFLDSVSKEEYISFVEKNKKVILKPSDMYAGIGIYLVENGDGDKRYYASSEGKKIPDDEVPDFETLREEHYIAEEYVFQASEYSEVFPESLNTVRVTTYINDEGKATILFAANQFGSSCSIVDNNDETAIWANIDIKTGTVTEPDIDEKSGLVFDIHPDTHAAIVGFKNLCWDEICNLALRLATAVPECRLIGWDIAVKKDYTLELIEGNVTPELELYQRISGKGLRNKMEIEQNRIK